MDSGPGLTNRTAGLAVKSKAFNFGVANHDGVPVCWPLNRTVDWMLGTVLGFDLQFLRGVWSALSGNFMHLIPVDLAGICDVGL